MSQRLAIKRREWSEKVEQWRRSGKSAQAWCKEEQVNYTLFITWRKRLKLDPKNSQDWPDKSVVQTSFVELKDPVKDRSGIILECAEVKIHLSQDFDAAVLRNCLSILREVVC